MEKILKFTREEFAELYSGFNPIANTTPTDICTMNNIRYEIISVEDGVMLVELEHKDQMKMEVIDEALEISNGD